jgi:hypothetical protein
LGVVLLNLGYYLYLWQRFQIKQLLQFAEEETGGSEQVRGLTSSHQLLISLRKFFGGLIIATLYARPQAQAALLFLLQFFYSIFSVYQTYLIRRKRKSVMILSEIFVCVIFLLFSVSSSFKDKTGPHETIYALLVVFYLTQILSVVVGIFQRKDVNQNEDFIRRSVEARQKMEEEGREFDKEKIAAKLNQKARKSKGRKSALHSNNSSRAQIALMDESVSNRSSLKGFGDSQQNLQKSSIIQSAQPSIKELELQDYDQIISGVNQIKNAEREKNNWLESANPVSHLRKEDNKSSVSR